MTTREFNTGQFNWKFYASNIQSNPNQNLQIDSSGNSSIFLRTNSTSRATLNSLGLILNAGTITTPSGTNLILDASNSNLVFRNNGNNSMVINQNGNIDLSNNLTFYNASTSTVKATTFSGSATNVGISTASSGVHYPALMSTITGSSNINTNTNVTFNASTNVLSSVGVNVTSSYQKNGTNIVSMVYGDISFNVIGITTPTSYTLNMPAGCDCYNLVSWNPVAAANNYLTIYDWSLGPWSGPLTANQIRITAALGNSVHLENFTIRFYWRV